jgi:hypothetical protein
MPLPLRYTEKKSPLYELIGAALVLIMLIITLTRAYIRFDWIPDLLWLLSAFILVTVEATKNNPSIHLPPVLKNTSAQLLMCLYLFLYHLLAFVLTLQAGGLIIVLYLAAALVYGLSLYDRATDFGIHPKSFEWKKIYQYPAWPMSAGILLCFLAMFFHMSAFTGLGSYYGMHYSYNYDYSYGYNYGYTFYNTHYIVKGYAAPWGTFALLLLFHMLVFQLLMTAGNRSNIKLLTFFKIAVPVLLLWWIFGAKGYKALKGFGNIIFIPGMLLMTMAVYFPAQLDDFIKKLKNKPVVPAS